ncbi:MAG: YhgE/Pip family protein, partial [Actinomycetia bacterium]|nr:YhgE/Pip family protein [Actinomycetes bacterium]
MRLLESTRRRPWWVQVVGLVLVPVLVAAGLLAATWDSDARLRQVEAAVVNHDQAVTINGQIVPLGRQLSAELVSSRRQQSFRWVLADEKSARSGLASGRYAAVVTIPREFSEAATSYGTDPTHAHQATIRVETSPQAGIADTALGQSVAQAAAQALNRTLTKTYLENIYLGFSTMGEKFQTVADAA